MTDLQEANRWLVAGDYPRAIKLYLRHAQNCPAEAADAYAGAAECCLRSNIVQAPVSVAPGVKLVSQGNLRGAEYYYRLALEADAKNVKALWGLSELVPTGSDERKELLERNVAVQPSALNVVALGDFYRTQLKDFERAYELYRQAVERKPRDETGYRRLNDICRRLGRTAESQEWTQRWQEVNRRRRRVDGEV